MKIFCITPILGGWGVGGRIGEGGEHLGERLGYCFGCFENGRFGEALGSLERVILLFGGVMREEMKKRRDEKETVGKMRGGEKDCLFQFLPGDFWDVWTSPNSSSSSPPLPFPSSPSSLEAQGAIIFRLCSIYHLALTLLLRLKTYENAHHHKSHSTFLSCILALLPLLPHHKKVCLRMGIRDNILAKNYEVGALLTALLWPSTTSQEHTSSLLSVLRTCEDHQNKNVFSSPLHPSLLSLCSSLSSNPSWFVGRPIVSSLSLKLLEGEWVECGWCLSGFLLLECVVGERCPVCYFGKIQNKRG